MVIPGAAVKHCIITEACHTAHNGAEGALRAAFVQIEAAYLDSLEAWKKHDVIPTFHLGLTVLRPDGHE